jgi:hypothetical protein
LGVEGESLGLGLGALGWDLFPLPEEADTGGVADADDQLAAGVK